MSSVHCPTAEKVGSAKLPSHLNGMQRLIAAGVLLDIRQELSSVPRPNTHLTVAGSGAEVRRK